MCVVRIVLWFFLHILPTLLVLLGLYHVLCPKTLKYTDGAINVTTTTKYVCALLGYLEIIAAIHEL